MNNKKFDRLQIAYDYLLLDENNIIALFDKDEKSVGRLVLRNDILLISDRDIKYNYCKDINIIAELLNNIPEVRMKGYKEQILNYKNKKVILDGIELEYQKILNLTNLNSNIKWVTSCDEVLLNSQYLYNKIYNWLKDNIIEISQLDYKIDHNNLIKKIYKEFDIKDSLDEFIISYLNDNVDEEVMRDDNGNN